MESNIISYTGQNEIEQIPLVNSNQVVTQSSSVLSSQLNPIPSMSTAFPVLTDPKVSISYAPIVSAEKPPQVAGQIPVVKVVPIYD